ncbi:MAG: hypothetical protein R3B57_02515 [Phycisphaerales bacterium]
MAPAQTTRALPLRLALLALLMVAAPASRASMALDPPAALPTETLEGPERTASTFGYIVNPISPNGIGIHVNMPVIRYENHGWDRLAQIVQVANAGGFYIMLNNMDGPRQGQHVAATFDHWSFQELMTFASVLANSRVPVLMYVGAVEDPDVMFVVGPDRLQSWRLEVAWIKALTSAPAGLAIDAASLGQPGGAPDGGTFLGYFSMYAQAMAAFNIEVGFEAFRLDNQNRPLEDRRYYALLQYVVTRFATLPTTADTDARIMSAVDAIPVATCPLRNTVWLDNTTWNELADGDSVPQEWLTAWGVTPDQLQSAVASRLYAKGYGLILPPSAFGIN